ncbi:MAG: ribonuclease J [Bacilli bacterium]|nr:ribonuclease J [Bacilli bacterium]
MRKFNVLKDNSSKNIKRTNTAGVTIFAFGGLNEVGKNAYCIETNKTIIIVDIGIKFLKIRDDFIKCTVPDIKYLNFVNKVKILVITHGHEDHIGGVLFLIKNTNISIIYAPKLVAELIRHKIKMSRFKGRVAIVEYDSHSQFNFQNKEIKISFFSVTHSIPDSFGVIIDTVDGRIATTGDFKIDLTPINNANIELNKIAYLGKEKVDLLLSDSTNAAIDGYTSSEKNVYQSLNNIFCKTKGRIIITTFSSSIFRIQQIVSIAHKYKRKIAIVGRSMEFSVAIALKHSYMDMGRAEIISVDEIDNFRSSEICIICTGSQGEEKSALNKIINGKNKIHIMPGDTIIFSSGTIPGNGEEIEKVMNSLSRFGANIYTNDIAQIHSSGHPSKQDLMLMLKLFKPKFFMPVHGEYYMLCEHARVASLMGIKKENIFVLNNGDSLILKQHNIHQGNTMPISPLFLDDDFNIVTGNIIFEKDVIRMHGVIVAIIFVSQDISNFKKPFFFIKGVVLNNEEYFKNRVFLEIKSNMSNFLKKTNDQIKKMVISLINDIVSQITLKKPLIVPVILTK